MESRGNTSLTLLVLFLVVIAGLGYLLYSKGYFGSGSVANLISDKLGSQEVSNPPAGGTTSSISTTPETSDVSSKAISITVSSPQNGATLSSSSVTVTGKTYPNADVFVNDQRIKADANGNFSAKISLDEGQNQIVVTANDAYGNAAERDLNVTVQTFQ